MNKKLIDETLIKVRKSLEDLDLQNIDFSDVFRVHFGICGCIRNQFLWNNPKVCKELNAYFKTDNVDDLSHKLLEYAIEEDRKKEDK